jgi:hypothetical protein
MFLMKTLHFSAMCINNEIAQSVFCFWDELLKKNTEDLIEPMLFIFTWIVILGSPNIYAFLMSNYFTLYVYMICRNEAFISSSWKSLEKSKDGLNDKTSTNQM